MAYDQPNICDNESFLSVWEINLYIETLLILPTDQLTNVFNITIEDRHR